MRKTIMAASLGGALWGCATTQVPTEQLVDSQVSIRAAEEMGAARVPAAARHLQLAQDQTRIAQALLEKGHRAEASQALQRAAADAELALALAREAPLRADAERAKERVQALERATQ